MIPVRRRELVSWALYDFANSAFATTILSVVYSVYFCSTVVPKGSPLQGATIWSIASGLSMGVVCLTAPIIGAISDYTASKKRLFFGYWSVGILACLGMRFVHPGEVGLGIFLFVLANIGFAGGNALYNAFLTELVPTEKLNRLSTFGWAAGYVGGGLCLVVNLLMMKWMADPGEATRWGFAAVGLWWFLFGLPFALLVKERAVPKVLPPGMSLVRAGFSDVVQTLRHIRRYRHLFLFLLAYLLYNEGVETVIANAAVFGNEVIHMSETDLIVCYLVIQAVAVGGALSFGYLAERWNGKKAIRSTLYLWLGVVGFAFVCRGKISFWILGILVGLVMGGTQALSRSLYAQLTPKEKSAEFFGFFAIGGKAAAALGMLLFGAATQLGGSMRWGIGSLAVFFLAGLYFLGRVDEQAGIREAERGAGGA